MTSFSIQPGTGNDEVLTKPKMNSFISIDWIYIVHAPHVTKLIGCIDWYPGKRADNVDTEYPYSSTYSCSRLGGNILTISGTHLGISGANVSIGGIQCNNILHTVPHKQITCILPKMPEDAPYIDASLKVNVSSALHPGLYDDNMNITYAVAPPPIQNVSVSNVAACSITLLWLAPEDMYVVNAITGYQIEYITLTGRDMYGNDVMNSSVSANLILVQNVTITTITGLNPSTLYAFRVRALIQHASLLEGNKYSSLLSDVTLGSYSLEVLGSTLASDIFFQHFTANSTLNHGPALSLSSIGPIEMYDGEGHYGLRLVGCAQVENCNKTSSCLDEIGELNSATSCKATFANVGTTQELANQNLHSQLNKQINISSNTSQDDLLVMSNLCGPALRLTGSHPDQFGAAWYPRAQTVDGGFSTTFKVRMSNTRVSCEIKNGEHHVCDRKGADGIAFVIQGNSIDAIGSKLGYNGMKNALAIEFDTYFDPDELDPYENHISVHLSSCNSSISSNHNFSLGLTNNVPDLRDSTNEIKIVYTPYFDAQVIKSGLLTSSSYAIELLKWNKSKLGLLYVYVNDFSNPRLILPIDIQGTLTLDNGRAFVGFTASTGPRNWQTHDILQWSFTSLRAG